MKEEAYLKQLKGYVVQGDEEKVYKLHKTFYGLKQTLRVWYNKIDSYLMKHGFKRSVNEPTLYDKFEPNNVFFIIVFYIDHLLVIIRDSQQVLKFKLEMQKEFDMSNLNLMKYFLA